LLLIVVGTEVTSEDDSDVCNLGSLNFARITSLSELADVVDLATKFLLCGTLVAEMPYAKVYETREKNRRLGLGIMGVHEFNLQRGDQYEVTKELHRWLSVYESASRSTASSFSNKLAVSNPVACRAVAPTGSIGILASTTTGIEPVYAVAIKRRYLKGSTWKYQYVVDEIAKEFIERYGLNPEALECSVDLAKDYQKRISFQAKVQDFVDMAISSTINLPAWGTEWNNEDRVQEFANTLAKYAHRLRGFTVYPDGSRGGQPLVSVPYKEALDKLGVELEENTEHFDSCDINGTGYCGM
jgi:ribonucleoside-diphosphate reductase alpha chain